MLNKKCDLCDKVHDNWNDIISCYEQNKNKVDWDWISAYQNLSEAFIEKFSDKLYLDYIQERKVNWSSVQEYAKMYNLEIDDEYLYAYRNHDRYGRGLFNGGPYFPGIMYEDWHCNCNPNIDNSFGFGIWSEGEIKVRVPLSAWGTWVKEGQEDKARVWKFEII